MNPETNQPVSTAADSTPPPAGRATVPVWLIVLMFLMLYWGALYFDANGGWFSPQVYTPYHSVGELEAFIPRHEGPDIGRGKYLFDNICALCHGPDGAGKPGQAPPLVGSEWVNTPGVNRIIRIPVLGLNGLIDVKGQQYSFPSGMTAVAATRQMMSDEDLANVLTYVRQAWGNKAPPVTAAQVKAIRDQLANRSQPLTVDELKSLPEK